jgi:hypothetical protein
MSLDFLCSWGFGYGAENRNWDWGACATPSCVIARAQPQLKHSHMQHQRRFATTGGGGVPCIFHETRNAPGHAKAVRSAQGARKRQRGVLFQVAFHVLLLLAPGYWT